MNDTELLQKVPSNMEDWKGFVSTTATITTIINFLTGLQVTDLFQYYLFFLFVFLIEHKYILTSKIEEMSILSNNLKGCSSYCCVEKSVKLFKDLDLTDDF